MLNLRLAIYAAAILAVLAGGWWLHNHLVAKGIAQQRAADLARYVELQRKADLETGRLQGLATAAEHAHDGELKDLRDYRAHNELHFRVCINKPASGPMRQATATNGLNAGSATAAPVGEPVPAPDTAIAEDRGPLLDAFAALFDATSANLRQWQPK